MDDIEAILEQVRMTTVLRDYHVEFLNSGEPEQLHCPFHHPDTNRSARFYPDDDSVYCFVCDKTWNVINFIKEKEELTFGETLRFLKQHYHVEIATPDYWTQMWAVRKPVPAAPMAMAEAAEAMFIKYADTLTSGNLYSILIVYNECLAEKDDLNASGNFSQGSMTRWYEESTAKLRMERQNG